MAEYVDFHYLPLEGKISGESMLKQTEDAINDLGEKVYSISVDADDIQQALDNSEQAIETANAALSTVTTGMAIWFNTVADLIDATIDVGVVAATKGYYLVNDGGAAVYIIRTRVAGDVDNGGSIIFLDNGATAELITNGVVSVKQFGAYGNGTNDDTTAFSNTIAYATNNDFLPIVFTGSYKVTSDVSGTFASLGEVTITGGGDVDIIDIGNLATDMQGYANSASASATNASTSATNASTSATNAASSASSASATATQIAEWLADKETLTAPAVDPSLTISGAAADAKVAGTLITNTRKLLNATNNLTDKIYLTGITWELGSFGSGGGLSTNDKRIRTASKIQFIEPTKLRPLDGYRYAVHYYATSTSTYHDTTRADGGASGWINVGDNYTIDANTWLTITVAKTSESGTYTADPSTWCNYVYVDAENQVIVNAVNTLVAGAEYNEKTELKSLLTIQGAINTNGTDNNSSGVLASYHRSDYIPMIKGTAILYTNLRATNLAGISAYDENKVFDSNSYVAASPAKSGEWVMPMDGYVRLCCRDTELSSTASFKAWNRYNYAIYALEGKVENIDGVPLSEEWKEYLATKEPDIKTALVNIGDTGEAFTFVTDCHIPRNNMLTPTIIRMLEKSCPVNYHINGGDFLDINTDSAQSALNDLWKWKDQMHGMTEYCIRGNHDNNNFNGENSANAITVGQFYAIMDRQIENIVDTNKKTYYCIDNESQKIRLILLDSSLADKTEMYSWMSTKLTELDSTWTILVIQHYLWGSTTESIHGNGQATINAINAVYSNINAEFIGILAGHTHVDHNATESVNGYLLIARDTNSVKSSTGTETLSFDYVTINTSAKTINFTKVGRGNDLSLSY